MYVIASTLTFADAVNLCMDTWTLPTVITGLQDEAELIHIQAKPLFVLVAITAPLLHRYERALRGDEQVITRYICTYIIADHTP